MNITNDTVDFLGQNMTKRLKSILSKHHTVLKTQSKHLISETIKVIAMILGVVAYLIEIYSI